MRGVRPSWGLAEMAILRSIMAAIIMTFTEIAGSRVAVRRTFRIKSTEDSNNKRNNRLPGSIPSGNKLNETK